MATMRRFTEFAISLTHRRCRHLLGVLVTILVLLVGYAFLSGEISGKAHGHIQADECISDLGAISGAHIHSGRWNGGCLSERYTAEGAGSRYARLYTFTLSQQSNIFIELTSIEEGDIEEGSAVPYLYLLQGQGKTGRVVAEDDDSTSYQTPNSRIAVDLEAGNYTIEATTYPAPRRGGFTLSVQVATSARGPEPWEVPEPHSVLKNGEGAPDDDESVAGTETRWDSVDATVSDSVPANDDPPSSDATLSSLTDSELQALMTRFSFWDNKDWDWYIDNIPFIETPDSRLDEVYYYRWEMVTKHLRYASPRVGYVATEFNDWPKYAGKYGAIVAPSGHQLYEMQWLRDRRFPQDYISLYFNEHSSKPYSFSSWLAENVWSLNKVHRNEEYAKGLLPELVKYYEHYEEMQFNPTLGLFWSHPIWDGMEYTVSTKRTADAFHGGVGYRPTLNSYMYANALAVQRIATMAGESNLASQYGRKATALKTNIQNRLWDEDRNFFLHMYRLNEHNGILAETLIDDTGPYTSDKKGREQMGFIPWAFNLPDDQTGAGYEAAWQYFDDPAYFQSAYGPRSAELSDHKYGITSRCCHWSGHSWPYATTQSLKALANVVRDYDQSQIDKSDYITALNTYVDVHMKGKANGTGIKPYIAEANQPDTGSWDGHDRADHSEHYFHSGFVDLVLTGLIGLQPQPDDTLILEPLVPATWDYFALDNLLYHGHEVAIIWDRDGTKYGRGPGFNVLVDEVGVHQSDTVPASLTINVGTAVNVARDGLANYAVNNTGKTYPEAIASNSFSLDPPSRATNGKYYYTSSPPDRWTSYNSSATEDWFRVDFGQDHTIHTVKLYFYDDGGGVQAPSSYRIQYWNGSSWVNVQEISRNPANPTGRRANVVKFSDVVTSRIRAVLSRNGGVAVGMTEFEAWGPSEPIPDSAADDNLALNADAWKYPRIFPSFAFINNSVFMVHDGDAKTFWSTRESRNGANEFLRVDFGEEKTFDRIDVNFRYAPTSMNLEYLNSGTWTAIQNVQMYPSTPTDDITTMAVFPAITAEQVRVNFTTSRLISVNEIEIHNSGLAVLAVEGKLTVHEGDDATYDVVLTRQPKADATVTVNSPTDNTEVTVAPATLTFTASNWNKEQTVTVAAAQDVDAVHDRATVTHTVSSTDAHYNGLVVEDLTVTVLDDEAAGLTARFEQVPLGHDGSSRFQLRVYFSEKVVLSYLDFSRALFETSGGTVRNARRLVRSSNIGWEVDVRPDGGGPVVITLPAGRACSISGAVCNSDGLWLTTTITATVPGPAPSVTSATALTVAEGATAVATLTATDADTGAESLTWSIPGGADAPKFAITTDGALSFAAAKDFENPDDSGGDGTYEVTVQVSDGVRSSTADLRVTLIDVNEAPTADAGNDQGDVAQGATVTLAATATDPDAGDTLTYAWAQTSGDNVTLSATGTATVTFDAPTGLTEDATLVFTLTVSDTGGLTGQDVVSVSVITTPPGPAPSVTSATALTVAEGATAVATLTAIDADTGAESLTWSIPGGADAPKFAITTDGALSFTMAKDFENPDDSGGDGTYEVTVQVSDGVRSSTADLRVTLIDVNEAPTADAGNDQGDVAQGATVTLAGTATDPDAGDTLTYAWAQTSGDNVTLSATGTATVTFDAPTGLTEDATLVFTLTVTDTGGLTGQDVVSVIITTPPGPAPSVTSATALTVAEGATAVATLTAIDADTGAEGLTWSIPGGGDAPKFAITTDGALSFTAAKDFENPDDSGGDGTYEVTVQVSDGVRSSTADLRREPPRVTLIDVNEAPTADAGNDQGDVAQGATVTLAATATDPDAGDTLTYAWAQTSGDNVTLSATGTATVTFDAPTGLTEDATLVFTLTVTDTGGLTGQDVVSVTASSGLTARFEQMPSSHDGSTRFTFWLYFSKEIDISYNDFTGSVFQITGGTVKRSRRLAPPSNIGWEIPVGPGGDDNVVITLPGNRACDVSGAICTRDGEQLSDSISATISGPAPVVQPGATIAAGTTPVAEGAPVSFIVSLDRTAQADLSIPISVIDDSGVLSAAAPTSAAFAIGDSSMTFTLPTRDDNVIEPPSTVKVSLAAGSGYTLGTTTSVSVSVTDNDTAAWTMSAQPAEIDEGSASTVTVAVSNNKTFAANQTVTLAAAGTASTSDYTLSATSLTLVAGASSVTATVTANDDNTTEGDETVIVTASHGGQTVGLATVTVDANDTPLSSDATLSSLALSGVDIGAFSSGTTVYSANVEYDVSSTTVTAEPNDDGAGVEIADADRSTLGTSRAVSLSVGGNEITVTVTAEDGIATKIYTVTLTRAEPSVAWGERLPDRDIVLESDAIPTGLWADNTNAWVIAHCYAGEVNAYALSEGSKQDELSITLADWDGCATAVWSNETTLWVTDLFSGGVRAYRLSDGARQSDQDLDNDAMLDEGNIVPRGLWSNGEIMWVGDHAGTKVFAYRLSDGARVIAREFELADDNGVSVAPFGLWSNGETLLVSSWTAGSRVLAYDLSDGQRRKSLDIDTGGTGTRNSGIWSDGETLWVVDDLAKRIFAYAVPGLGSTP